MPSGRVEVPIAIRFWRFVRKMRGCWIWTAYRNQQGYGRVYVHQSRRLESAHRVSWRLAGRRLPAGKWVLHACDNPPCVNPAHLFLGTREDNMIDWALKHPLPEEDYPDQNPLREYMARQRAQTTCLRGHPLFGRNLYVYSGHRQCRACHAMRQAARRTLKV